MEWNGVPGLCLDFNGFRRTRAEMWDKSGTVEQERHCGDKSGAAGTRAALRGQRPALWDKERHDGTKCLGVPGSSWSDLRHLEPAV